MSEPNSMLITSEMMENGQVPLLFTGGACNIQSLKGLVRNTGRDLLARWLDEQGWSYFDPQIHPTTHGRDYSWDVDSPQEKKARAAARLRVYEITSTTIAAVTILEIMDDARQERPTIVWFNNGKTFAPIGLGNRDYLKSNETLRAKIGATVFSHLLAYVNAGHRLRQELPLVLADCPHIVFADSFDEVKHAISHILSE